MPDELNESRDHTKPWAVATVPTEALLKARLAVDQIRLSRLATQNAIGRSRKSIAATSAVLVAFKHDLQEALRRKVQRRITALKPKRQLAANRIISNRATLLGVRSDLLQTQPRR